MSTSPKLTSQYHDRWLQLMSRLAFALLILALMPRAAHAQGLPTPPERMSYQGYLVDGNGGVLGANAPKNYDVIFRIYTGRSAVNSLWTEQQTVTVDKGYFSVLLGEGSAFSGGPHAPLSSLFAGTDASERYMEFTVRGIGSGSPPGDVTILPRLKLLTSPYAFLAKNAGALLSPNGTTLVTADNGILTVHGAIAGGGTELTALNAGNIASGTLLDARLSPNVALRSGSNTFNGNQYITVGGIFMDNDQVFSAKTTAGTYEGFLWPRVATNDASYLNYGSGGFHIRTHDSGFETMFMKSNGDVEFNGTVRAPAVIQTSDQRLKKDFAPLKNPRQTVMELQGVSFNWRREEFPGRNLPASRQIGFVAQEVKKVIPEAVVQDGDGYYSLNYNAVVPVLVEAIKEHEKDLQAKAKTIQDLELRLADLEAMEKTRAAKFAALESLIEQKLGDVRQASRRTSIVEAKN